MSDAGALDDLGEQAPPAVTLGGTGLGAHSGGEIAAALAARPEGGIHVHTHGLLHAADRAVGVDREGGGGNKLEKGGRGEGIGLGVGGSVVGEGTDRAEEATSARSVQSEEAAVAAMQASRRLPTPLPPSPRPRQWSSSQRYTAS